MKTIELLEKIKQEPIKYLGCKSIRRLPIFLSGYLCGLEETRMKVEWPFSEFQSWVQNKYKTGVNQHWSNYILLYSIDDNDAFDHFFILFDEFMEKEYKAKESILLKRKKSKEKFNLYKLMYKIQLRPAMYFGKDSVELFKVFMAH